MNYANDMFFYAPKLLFGCFEATFCFAGTCCCEAAKWKFGSEAECSSTRQNFCLGASKQHSASLGLVAAKLPNGNSAAKQNELRK